jgi:hypothetical protein
MDKQHILDEIRRTAEKNGGQALGKVKFFEATGIKESDWSGRYWTKWSDAVAEAGYSPNTMQRSFDDADILESLAQYIIELDKYPTVAELKFRRKSDPAFPSKGVFSRLGYRPEVARKLIEHCDGRAELQRVVEICTPIAAEKVKRRPEQPEAGELAHGFVYLMKSGKHYKIGFTKSIDRRRYELGPKLPLGIEPIHSIRTDDPAGIEAYWHRRFKDKHLNGEWFDLSPQDVAAFKRRKFM